MMGDFNEVLNFHDKLVSSVFSPLHSSYLFELCALMGIQHVHGIGSHYTWCNNPYGSTRVNNKLDTIMGNVGWFYEFSCSLVEYREFTLYNHTASFISLLPTSFRGKPPLKFLSMWLGHPEYGVVLARTLRTGLGSDLHYAPTRVPMFALLRTQPNKLAFPTQH